ncbi:ATPase inhibitor IATP mitochondria [Penicillium concentricum]|uniref:ATPase inhibitor, mitochondrial n=1 Tax=Penicillium concentricum TaxID=293559 RepID=A0A9W9VCF9_9EURO|nr:ATPase inhibitor IATP mitochondria [Penicillium concentricum]KAJ5374351.1 ATPase inhibitor IATP mitochondria [Penicillium concentricum]
MQATTRPVLRITTNLAILRSLSTTPRIMGAGDLGSTKSGFMAEYGTHCEIDDVISNHPNRKDSFAKREAAHEGMYIREREMEKLERLKAKVKEQRKHMDELDKHLEEYTKNQGGEQN